MKKSENKIRKYSVLIAKHIARKTHKYRELVRGDALWDIDSDRGAVSYVVVHSQLASGFVAADKLKNKKAAFFLRTA